MSRLIAIRLLTVAALHPHVFASRNHWKDSRDRSASTARYDKSSSLVDMNLQESSDKVVKQSDDEDQTSGADGSRPSSSSWFKGGDALKAFDLAHRWGYAGPEGTRGVHYTRGKKDRTHSSPSAPAAAPAPAPVIGYQPVVQNGMMPMQHGGMPMQHSMMPMQQRMMPVQQAMMPMQQAWQPQQQAIRQPQHQQQQAQQQQPQQNQAWQPQQQQQQQRQTCSTSLTLTEQLSHSACTLGSSYGCGSGSEMYVDNGCSGVFNCNGMVLTCKSRSHQRAACSCEAMMPAFQRMMPVQQPMMPVSYGMHQQPFMAPSQPGMMQGQRSQALPAYNGSAMDGTPASSAQPRQAVPAGRAQQKKGNQQAVNPDGASDRQKKNAKSPTEPVTTIGSMHYREHDTSNVPSATAAVGDSPPAPGHHTAGTPQNFSTQSNLQSGVWPHNGTNGAPQQYNMMAQGIMSQPNMHAGMMQPQMMQPQMQQQMYPQMNQQMQQMQQMHRMQSQMHPQMQRQMYPQMQRMQQMPVGSYGAGSANGQPQCITNAKVCGATCCQCGYGLHDAGKCKKKATECLNNGMLGEMMEHFDFSCPGPA